jgi:hypothetical protein
MSSESVSVSVSESKSKFSKYTDPLWSEMIDIDGKYDLLVFINNDKSNPPRTKNVNYIKQIFPNMQIITLDKSNEIYEICKKICQPNFDHPRNIELIYILAVDKKTQNIEGFMFISFIYESIIGKDAIKIWSFCTSSRSRENNEKLGTKMIDFLKGKNFPFILTPEPSSKGFYRKMGLGTNIYGRYFYIPDDPPVEDEDTPQKAGKRKRRMQTRKRKVGSRRNKRTGKNKYL